MESEIGDDVPIVGMEFESMDVVIQFYNTYGRRVAFDWRNRSLKKNADGVVYYVMLICNWKGRAESKVDETKRTYPKGPTGCKVRMIASSDVDGSWIVRVVELEHCHDLNCTNLSIAAYEYFGDVVSFDTTYLTNKYNMLFAAFVRVNHHRQSILLGCVLLNSEKEASFVWLFNSWVNFMSRWPPVAIVTDQCPFMRAAITKVLPHTRRRWCLWHIIKKVHEKLKGYGCYEDIQVTLSEVVHQSLTIEEFEDNWTDFVNAYCLKDNKWLQRLLNDGIC
ncbi:hypothetical protein AHAS_Ahas19G0268900 [Arachis hypogaea]